MEIRDGIGFKGEVNDRRLITTGLRGGGGLEDEM